MSPEEIESLSRVWILEWRASFAETEHIWDAMDQVEELGMRNPEICWKVIRAVMTLDQTADIMMMLAVGPLESVLECHGPQFIERAEQWASVDPVFAKMMSGVLCDPEIMRPEIIRRMEPFAALKEPFTW
jgi:hypothetical protein